VLALSAARQPLETHLQEICSVNCRHVRALILDPTRRGPAAQMASLRTSTPRPHAPVWREHLRRNHRTLPTPLPAFPCPLPPLKRNTNNPRSPSSRPLTQSKPTAPSRTPRASTTQPHSTRQRANPTTSPGSLRARSGPGRSSRA
jgi:hypothetical protein